MNSKWANLHKGRLIGDTNIYTYTKAMCHNSFIHYSRVADPRDSQRFVIFSIPKYIVYRDRSVGYRPTPA